MKFRRQSFVATKRIGLTAVTLTVLVISTVAAQWWNVNAGRNSSSPKLVLDVFDKSTGQRTAARFALLVDGKPFFPKEIGNHGLRFVSVHKSRGQILTVTYARGTGPVEVSLPKSAKQIQVQVAKGFEYLPVTIDRKINKPATTVQVKLQRWANLRKDGWVATDAHLHYDRLNRKDDQQWLTMLAGDDLHAGQFMVLKGGQVPGIWARQYAYGKAGEAFDGERLICSGEEYRDSAQGHINLFGISEIIEPISTGGIGTPPVRYHFPPLHDVFEKSRKLGGFGGVAHGGSLGSHPTAILDAVLGKLDFFEIANAHLYAVGLWYRLLNCGYDLPPTAGTDLPNYPYRDAWQPFLGSMRMYVHMKERRDFAAWKQAVQQGRVVVTSGPLLSLQVNQAGPGETIHLPAAGGEIVVRAELSSPIGLKSFEIINNGQPIPITVEKINKNDIDRWRVQTRLKLTKSCWLAACGKGVVIDSLQKLNWPNRPWIETSTVAHTAPVRVIVGEQPILSAADAKYLIKQLLLQQEFYRTKGVYAEGAHRLRVLELFDAGIAGLKKRL